VFDATGSRVWFGLLDGTWVDVAALHLSSFTRVTLLTLSFYSLLLHILLFVKRLRPLFVGGAYKLLLID